MVIEVKIVVMEGNDWEGAGAKEVLTMPIS